MSHGPVIALVPAPDELVVEHLAAEPGRLIVVAGARRPEAACPVCGWRQIAAWRAEYNAARPHSGLASRTPEEFARGHERLRLVPSLTRLSAYLGLSRGERHDRRVVGNDNRDGPAFKTTFAVLYTAEGRRLPRLCIGTTLSVVGL